MRGRFLAVILGVALAGFGCGGGGDDDGSDGPRGDGASGDGPAGVDGAGDAPAVAACPGEPVGDGDPCTDPLQRCSWLRCADERGYVEAACNGTTYAVTYGPCEGYGCSGGGGGPEETCGADQLCYQIAGGALLVECRANPCGDGAIESSCACEDLGCPGGCSVSGRMVYCNTCPPGPPCP